MQGLSSRTQQGQGDSGRKTPNQVSSCCPSLPRTNPGEPSGREDTQRFTVGQVFCLRNMHLFRQHPCSEVAQYFASKSHHLAKPEGLRLCRLQVGVGVRSGAHFQLPFPVACAELCGAGSGGEDGALLCLGNTHTPCLKSHRG